jgi:hypothetical protein
LIVGGSRCKRYPSISRSPCAIFAASFSRSGNRWPQTSAVIAKVEWPSIPCPRFREKFWSISHEAKKWRKVCRPYFARMIGWPSLSLRPVTALAGFGFRLTHGAPGIGALTNVDDAGLEVDIFPVRAAQLR